MRHSDNFPYRLRGSRIGGSVLDMLRITQAYPAAPADSRTIANLIIADATGDYPLYFPTKDPVEFGVLSPVPTNSEYREFEAVVDDWKTFGWEVRVFNDKLLDYEKWNPQNIAHYGVRR